MDLSDLIAAQLPIGTDVQAWGATLDALIPYNFNADGLGLLQGTPDTSGGFLTFDSIGVLTQAWNTNLDTLATGDGSALTGNATGLTAGTASSTSAFFEDFFATAGYTTSGSNNIFLETDGDGSLLSGVLHTDDDISVGNIISSGTTSLDNGNITTDGSGNLTTQGTVNFNHNLTCDNMGNVGIPSGNLHVGNQGIQCDGQLVVSGATFLDGFNISTDSAGTLTALAFIGYGGGLTGLPNQTFAGTKTATGTATTTFTVAIGHTMANTNYSATAEGSNLLSSAVHWTTNKTTTTFDVVYATGLTGTVVFDWAVTPYN